MGVMIFFIFFDRIYLNNIFDVVFIDSKRKVDTNFASRIRFLVWICLYNSRTVFFRQAFQEVLP
jgi:hypothetical protein